MNGRPHSCFAFASRCIVTRFARALPRVVTRACSTLALLALATPSRAVTVPSSFVVENAVPGVTFTVPTQVCFMPDGRYFVTEKRGRVLFVTNGVVQSTPVIDLQGEVLDNEDRGLLSIAVDPNFASNRYIYLLYTVDPNGDGNDSEVIAFGRLTRYTLNSSFVATTSTRKVLIGDTWTNGVPEGSTSHSIGTLRWGADGSLLVSAGDGALFTETDAGGKYAGLFGSGKTDSYEDIGAFRAQSLSSLAGKILRINPADGTGYPSNPYWDGNATSKRSRIWCYGMRNPFRFNVRPSSGSTDVTAGDPGTLYIGDVGLTTWEEANVAPSGGKNFGWPCYEGRYTNSSYQNASPAHNGCGSMGTSDNPTQPTLPPIAWHHSDASAGTPSGFSGNCSIGGTFYTGSQYPAAYHGRYFFADYGQDWIRVATFDGNDQLLSVQSFASTVDDCVNLETDPLTGNIFYVSITTGQVRRIRYTAVGGNAQPIPSVSASPEVGTSPLAVQFSSAGTFDPDSDPMSYSWAFGDGQGSTSANPSHTYSASGTFSAVLTVDDSKGGVARDTVKIYVSAPGSFPTTPVLDNFNRADGTLGGSWVGGFTGLILTGSQLGQTGGAASAVWNGAVYGPTQEASITINQFTSGATEHDLMLKIQGTSWDDGHIEVRYDVDPKTVTVSTYTGSQGWVRRGGPYALTLAPGDRLGARAYGDGSVEVYKNSTRVAITTVGNWPYGAQGGRIGLTITDATQSRFDNFAGGNAVLNANTPPVATIATPAAVSYFVAGDNIALSGSATDNEDATGTLLLRWEVDLVHNNHVHPSIYSFTGATGSFTGTNHDDGTGVYYLVRFLATDPGGLADTTTAKVYPQIDLRATGIQTSPASPTDASPTQVSFTLQNLGGMPAPISRWQLRIDGTSIATGDTLVPPLSSVTISVNAGTLAGGAHVLRATADTLGQVFETVETNNGTSVSISVRDGAPPTFTAGPTATPNATNAVIAWSTNEAATGAVRYGLTSSLGDSVTATSATSQSKTLPNLARSTPYFYRVAATDAAGNTRLSSITSFTTLANRAPVASASGSPASGPAPLTVQFSSTGSSDPDGDPITFSWNFGDATTSTAASPSHVYSGTGSYTATLTVSDGFGGSNSATVPISVSTFPSTAVIDNFNRANGAIGGSWTAQTSGLAINSNRLVQTTSGFNTIIWNGAIFGADQEAYVTIAALTPLAPEYDLVMKVQGTSATSAQLEVRYDDQVKQLKVSTYTSAGGWVRQATLNQTFVAGDRLGARAYANGTVDVYRNGTKVTTVSITSWAYATAGGRIGMTLGLVTSSAFDDFGGGTVASGPDVTPPAFTSGPAATPGSTSATVTWGTNEAATGSVRYGKTTALGDSVLTALATTGNATLPSLTSGTLYYYRVAVRDAAGNTTLSAQATFTTTSGTPVGFPATAVLDNFNRGTSSTLGGSWVAATAIGVGTQANQMVVNTSSSVTPIFDGGVFGANQEGYITVTTLPSGAQELDVLLKVQGTVSSAGHIEVRYDDSVDRVMVSTYNPTNQSWTNHGSVNTTLVGGDQLGARAFNNGTVEVYRNATLLGSFSVASWPFYSQGGRLGLNFGLAGSSRLDNFGGGTLPAGAQPALLAGDPGAGTLAVARDVAGTDVTRLSLSGAVPNPSHGPVDWSLSLPRAAAVSWEVVDLQGRSLMRTSQDLPAGTARLTWKPAGRVPPGIYLVVVRTSGTTLTRRFVLF